MENRRFPYFTITENGDLLRIESPMRPYQRRYEDRHPEKTLQWRLNTYINALKRNGYTVIKDGETL